MQRCTYAFRRSSFVWRVLGLSVVFLVILALLVSHPSSAQAAGSTYTVNCSASTNGNGTSSPWNTLSSVNSHTFVAGDQLLFVSGTTCNGQLTLKGSGTSSTPISVGVSGTGAQPIINAQGADGAVITLKNVQYWNLQGLALTNSSSTENYRQGILAENDTSGVLHHIHISGMYIHDISGYPGGWYNSDAGISVQTDHVASATQWDDILIQGNFISNVNRIGIAVGEDHDGDGISLTTNAIVENNTIVNDGGDDILMLKTSGAVVQYNTASEGGGRSYTGCPPDGDYCNNAAAGMWIAASQYGTFQYNQENCFHSSHDGEAFDIDWGNHNMTLQYNYSSSNQGGLLLIVSPFNFPGEPTASTPDDGIVVRDNISDNDRTDTGCSVTFSSYSGRGLINFSGNIPNLAGSSGEYPDFYNNDFYVPNNTVNTNIVAKYSGTSASGTYIFDNNLVENFGPGGYVQATVEATNNLFYGNHPSTEPSDPHKVTSDPKVENPGNGSSTSSYLGPNAYLLQSSSPARGAGAVIANNGGQDLFGYPVSSSAAPNIGAYNGSGPGGNQVQNSGFETGSLAPWSLSGSGSSVVGSHAHEGSHALQTGAANSGADVTISGLAPNTLYRLTGWEEVATAGEFTSIGVKSYGGTETYVHLYMTGYAQVNITFKTGSSNTSANIYCYKNSGVSASYCDDILLFKL